ncbi:MAG: type II toxin-antitoxin system VapC family toxin [Acidobacteria bacterium]|nr:type II toxin-antitoxin system VapC family toxin [Acidobacteriota bacterium]
MANYFFDTSALAKHYRAEQGTPEVERILREPGSVHYISRLVAVELQSVFALKARTQEITTQDLQQLQKHIATDFAARRFPVVRMLQRHFQEAERLLKKHAPSKALRTLDSLQLAVALSLNREGKIDHFVCADDKLCKVAEDEGLSVVNPS